MKRRQSLRNPTQAMQIPINTMIYIHNASYNSIITPHVLLQPQKFVVDE